MSSSQGTFHNNFFLAQFRNIEFATSFFQEYLPIEVKKLVDWNQLHLAPGDFVQKALQNRKSDILYETRIHERKGFFYLHLEHQRKSVENMVYRMLIYQANIWQQHEKQYPKQEIPLIIPMVLYQGISSWNAPLSFHEYLQLPDALRSFVPDFLYALVDLSHLSDEELQGEIKVQIALLVMKHIDSPKITEFLFEILMPLILELGEKETGLEYLEIILYYLSSAGPHLDKEQVIQKLQEQPESKSIQEVIMTLAEQWKLEGRQEGELKGRQEGELIGEIRFAQKMLKQPQTSKEALFQKTSEDLKTLLEQLEGQLSL